MIGPYSKLAEQETPRDSSDWQSYKFDRAFCPPRDRARMSGMRDVLKESSPLKLKPHRVLEPKVPGLLSRVGTLFGFGLLNPKIMWYALGTFMFGLGAGLSIDSWLRTGQALSDRLAWSGLGLAIIGNVIGNLSHGYLKKEARRKQQSDAAIPAKLGGADQNSE
jgi:hypothetical protein